MVPGAGFEPARGFPQGILSPLRLPFRHPGVCEPATQISPLEREALAYLIGEPIGFAFVADAVGKIEPPVASVA